MDEPIELTDGRITLRTPTVADAPAVAEAVQSAYEAISPWMPWAVETYGIEVALAWINNELDPTAVALVITDPEQNVIGSTGLNHFDEANRGANLGYWLRTDATGNGYATTATKLVADYGLNTLNLKRIEVIMSVENKPSRQVAERAGAHYEGVLRNRLLLHGRSHDVHSYSFVPADPERS